MFLKKVQEKVIPTQKRVLTSGGRLVLGQELDSVEGVFSKVQLLQGEMSELFISDEAIFLQAAINYTVHCQPIPGYYPVLYDFSDKFHKFILNGDIEVHNVSREDICYKTRGLAMVHMALLDYNDGREYCKRMKGYMFAPMNEIEDRSITNNDSRYAAACTGTYSTQFWFGIRANKELTGWINDRSENPIEFDNFDKPFSKPVGTDSCVSKGVTFNNGLWYTTPCDKTACVICFYDKVPSIQILGLCDMSLIENKIYLDQLLNGKWTYVAPFHTRLLWTNESWVLINNDNSATLKMDDPRWTALPLGRHNWTVFGDRCQEMKVSKKILQ